MQAGSLRYLIGDGVVAEKALGFEIRAHRPAG